jgi:hypothetical protein
MIYLLRRGMMMIARHVFVCFNYGIYHRYTKALDNIKTIRKDQLVQIKLDETTLSHIKEDKDKADQVH